ncbi:hypothetical protein DH2020_002546 [Rehmannia glutinosa]|uniref:Uncharacterized protein n=1 Tax=Rehmannia glutinosa TaxID=99300 RepID=A0ABR0XUG8_REHGL
MVRRGEDSHISQRYFIPPKYKVIIPERDDRMHRPPRNCFSFHLSTLDAGLRFPLHQDIEDILIHLGMSVKASLVAKVIREQKEKLIAAARLSGLVLPPSPSVHSSEPTPSAPSLVPYSEAQSSEPGHGIGSDTNEPEPLPLEHPPPILTIEAKKKARTEKAKPSEEEISIALCEIEDRQNKLDRAREQDHVEASRPPRQFSGTRVILKWKISPESCIMKTRAGEDSLELYQACILPQDQFALTVMPDTKLEEIVAHDLMRAANVAHNLTLRSHHWRIWCQDAEALAQYLEKEKVEIKLAESEESFQASQNEVARLTRESSESFAADQEAGKKEAPNSPEFAKMLKDARVSGSQDFKNSPIFDRLVMEKAAEFEVMGFCKCQSQVHKLGGFKADFYPSKLEPELDGNGEKAPVVEEESEDLEGHEFSFLLQDPDPATEGMLPPGDQAHEEGDDLLDVATLLGPTSRSAILATFLGMGLFCKGPVIWDYVKCIGYGIL